MLSVGDIYSSVYLCVYVVFFSSCIFNMLHYAVFKDMNGQIFQHSFRNQNFKIKNVNDIRASISENIKKL